MATETLQEETFFTYQPEPCDSVETPPPPKERPLLEPKDYHNHFDTQAYLEFFYSKKATSDGLKILLFCLPNLARRIPEESCQTLLDVGSGPTTYVGICFRNVVQSIYLTDYADQSCDALRKWLSKEKGSFDWRHVTRCISQVEGERQSLSKMEDDTRKLVEGVWRCDVHLPALFLPHDPHRPASFPPDTLFDIVTSIFCLESACANLDEYRKAMKNVVSRVKPGGYFIIGSVLEDDTYQFGTEHQFKLLFLTEEDILGTMKSVGLDTENAICMAAAGCFVVLAKLPEES